MQQQQQKRCHRYTIHSIRPPQSQCPKPAVTYIKHHQQRWLRLLVVMQPVQQYASLGITNCQQPPPGGNIGTVHIAQRRARRGPVAKHGSTWHVQQLEGISMHAATKYQHLRGGRKRQCINQRGVVHEGLGWRQSWRGPGPRSPRCRPPQCGWVVQIDHARAGGSSQQGTI